MKTGHPRLSDTDPAALDDSDITGLWLPLKASPNTAFTKYSYSIHN